jgi:hypothetical protein
MFHFSLPTVFLDFLLATVMLIPFVFFNFSFPEEIKQEERIKAVRKYD